LAEFIRANVRQAEQPEVRLMGQAIAEGLKVRPWGSAPCIRLLTSHIASL
jgi:hypothetical protein